MGSTENTCRKLGVVSCLKKEKKRKQPSLCVTKISNSVEASNINKAGINEQFNENVKCSDYFTTAFCPWCSLITSLWSITFTVQLMRHPPLFKVYTRPCEHQDELYSARRSRDFVWCTWHCVASKSMTGHLLEYSHFMVWAALQSDQTHYPILPVLQYRLAAFIWQHRASHFNSNPLKHLWRLVCFWSPVVTSSNIADRYLICKH